MGVDEYDYIFEILMAKNAKGEPTKGEASKMMGI